MAQNNERSYGSYLLIWIGTIIAFAAAYWGLSYVPGQSAQAIVEAGDSASRFLVALYFSIITGTTVGYGDVLPLGLSRGLAAVESLVSFVLLATFVSRVASSQQDAAIKDIHTLSRDSLFNNFRHGLFISRKDLDKLIEKVEVGEQLGERDWRNLRTSLRHIHTQIRNLPQLYTSGRSVSDTLDEDHEQLLLDSVERSLRRVRETVEILESHNHQCRADGKCMAEINTIVHASTNTFTTLHTHPENKENAEAYDEVLTRLAELKTHIA